MKQNSKNQINQQQILIQRGLTIFIAFSAVFVITLLALNVSNIKRSNAATGMHGAKVISSTNVIINEFTKLTSDASAGTTTISVTSSALNTNNRFTSSLTAGELVLIIQMQGATINTANSSSYGTITAYNNAGRYEFAEVASVPGPTSITLTAGLKYSYTTSGNVQVVRVPRYTSLTVNSGAILTTDPLDGSVGGILAAEVTGITTIDGSVNASGLGFRGGQVEQFATTGITSWTSAANTDGAEKGESIAGYQSSYSSGRYGRGAPANGGGGGNAHNAAGGGGANGGNTAAWNGLGNPDTSVAGYKTAWDLEATNFYKNTSSGGGRGGYSYSNTSQNPLTKAPGANPWSGDNRSNVGGYGGRPLDYSTGRIFMGGGGGAGDSNDGNGTAGANGGGIIFILGMNDIAGAGTVKANGNDGTTTGSTGNGDGSGGGGGGGTIILIAKGATVKNISIRAAGGKGGMQSISTSAEAEGAGGGGGGGYIAYTAYSGSGLITYAGGLNGTTNASPMTNFPANGATSGGTGTLTTAVPSSPYSSTSLLPVKLVSFKTFIDDHTVVCKWITASEVNNDYFIIERKTGNNDFQPIGRVTGAGTSSTMHTYTFTDKNPGTGVVYYRLMQRDFDGTATWSQVSSVKLTPAEAFKVHDVYPVPFIEEINLALECQDKEQARFELFNDAGKCVYQFKLDADAGISNIKLQLPADLPSGPYIFSVSHTHGRPYIQHLLKK